MSVFWMVRLITGLFYDLNNDYWLAISPKSEPALELISRAVPSVEAHHRSVGPDAGRNSGWRQIKTKQKITDTFCLLLKWQPEKLTIQLKTTFHHLNTRLVEYSDPHYIAVQFQFKHLYFYKSFRLKGTLKIEPSIKGCKVNCQFHSKLGVHCVTKIRQ